GIFTTEMEIFFKEHDFSYDGPINMINPLMTLNYYINSSEYEFIDIDDEFLHIYNEFKTDLKVFIYKFSMYTAPSRYNREQFCVIEDRDWHGMGEEQAKKIREQMKELNNYADELYNKIISFYKRRKEKD
ncbi:hypothetical protein, partial [Sulfurimonas sp.]|uniref:hypothetical protein n=1 Tax=Sulfurimonas sp. TaxID=2022749 RepID=UPI0025EDBFA0